MTEIPFIRSSRCKVCSSRYMRDYHKAREEGKTFDQLQEFATQNGEFINQQAFRRHFKNHWFTYLDKIQKTEDSAKEIIISKLSAGANLVDEIYTNLNSLRDLSKSIIMLAKEDPSQIRNVTELLREIRQTLDMILKLRDKLSIEPQEDARTVIKKVLKTLIGIVPEEVLAQWAHSLEGKI